MTRTQQVFVSLSILHKMRIKPKSCTEKRAHMRIQSEVVCKRNVKHNMYSTEKCSQYVLHRKVFYNTSESILLLKYLVVT